MSESIETRVNAILSEREVRGLHAPVIARLLIAIPVIPGIVGQIEKGDLLGVSRTLTLSFTALLAAWFLLNVYLFYLLRAKRHVGAVGVLGAFSDVVFFGAQLLLGLAWMEGAGIPMISAFKSQLPNLGIALICINALALRPRYPLIVAVGATLALGIGLLYAMTDPMTAFSNNPKEVFAGTAAGKQELVNLFLIFPIIGTIIVFITRVARKTVHQAITQEQINAQLQREQLEIVMKEKVHALGKLVAGVSHELNNPLGVIRSGLDTQLKAIDQLAPNVGEEGKKPVRVLRRLFGNVREAVDRISATEESLRSLAHLDEADLQKLDLNEELTRVIERTPVPGDKEIRLERTFADLPHLMGNAKELNQALATILENAFDAIEAEGVVEVRTSATDEEVEIKIRDSGRGMSTEQVANLFDVDLRPGQNRVSANFGLPTAQHVAHRHGGRISVESTLGEGATFILHLPLS